MKNYNRSMFFILPILFVSCFIGILHGEDVKKINDGVISPGFTYWYAPPLLDMEWQAIISGTVIKLEKHTERFGRNVKRTFIKGRVKIHEVIYAETTPKEHLIKADILTSSGGFKNLLVGDKILIFLIEYEGDYALPDIGLAKLKIKNFDAPAVEEIKKFMTKYERIKDITSFRNEKKQLIEKLVTDDKPNIMFIKKYTNKSYTQMLNELGSPASEITYTIEKASTKGWNHHDLFKLYPRNNTNKNVRIKEVSWSDGNYVIMACFHFVKGQYQCIVAKRIKVGVRF